MEKRALGRTGLEIAPLVFGGNVFGWTADEKTSFELLDGFTDAGFNAIDTADVYSSWVPGNTGGESETIIGKWLKSRPSMRDKVVIITKVGSDMGDGKKGLSPKWIATAVEDSLRRLQTETIDLYLSHWPDPEIPYEETLGAYDTLLNQGKIRAIGASNLDEDQLAASIETAKKAGVPRYGVLQPEYNLYDRKSFDGPLAALCRQEEMGVITYFSLASGFLSGKYRTQKDLEGSNRGDAVKKYMNERGTKILDALDTLAKDTGAKPAEIALAWIMARNGVTAPIASATSLAQLESLTKSASLKLSDDAMALLTKASDY